MSRDNIDPWDLFANYQEEISSFFKECSELIGHPADAHCPYLGPWKPACPNCLTPKYCACLRARYSKLKQSGP